jgi:two-component system cell cycle response regulator
MQFIALLGLTDAETKLIKNVLAVAGSRGLKYAVADGKDALQRASIVVADASNSREVTRWTAFRATHEDVSGIMLVDDDVPEGCPADTVLKKPIKAITFMTALGQIDIKRRPVVGQRLQQTFQGGGEAAVKQATAAPTGGSAVQNPLEQYKGAWTGRILVVDDSATIRKQLSLVLEHFGLQVTTADNGELALHLIATQDFEAVLLDVVLPGADGYQICKTIRRNKAKAKLPVIMLTSRSSPFDRVRGSIAGCDSYMTKPTNIKQVAGVLAKYFGPDAVPFGAAKA